MLAVHGDEVLAEDLSGRLVWALFMGSTHGPDVTFITFPGGYRPGLQHEPLPSSLLRILLESQVFDMPVCETGLIGPDHDVLRALLFTPIIWSTPLSFSAAVPLPVPAPADITVPRRGPVTAPLTAVRRYIEFHPIPHNKLMLTPPKILRARRTVAG